MISLIVIGRNEGWRLRKCFESIRAAVRENGIDKYEVIYVDSRSTDGSAETAKAYGIAKVFSITGTCNAAIARNIGAREAIGDVLFFIDGDMEIVSDGLAELYSVDRGLCYPFVSGNWLDYHYRNIRSCKPESIEPKSEMQKDRYEIVVGGLFLIERNLWEEVGGMKTNMRRSQDWELAIRLARKGVPLLRRNVMLAKHHTVLPDKSIRRAWGLLLSGEKYYRAVILRDHWSYLQQWKHFVRTNYTFLALWSVIVPTSLATSPWVLGAYPLLVFVRSLRRARGDVGAALGIFSIVVAYEVTLLLAILFFRPRERALEYKTV